MVSACGGDITGDWLAKASCAKISGTLNDMDCPGATVSGSLQITGTASYTSGLTYTWTHVSSGTETIGFPASCLTSAGVTLTCEQLNASFAAIPSLAMLGLHCTNTSGGGCACTATVSAMTTTEAGTYTTTSDGILTLMPTGDTPVSDGYCVKGNTLDLTPPASFMDEPGLMLTGDLTFVRQ